MYQTKAKHYHDRKQKKAMKNSKSTQQTGHFDVVKNKKRPKINNKYQQL